MAEWISTLDSSKLKEFHTMRVKFLLQKNDRLRCITVMEVRRTLGHGQCVL